MSVVALLLALGTPATAAAPPEVVKLRREVVALKAKLKKVTAQRNAALREVASLKAQLRPKPTGSLTLTNGENGDKARVSGGLVTEDGDILGQIEYLGGLTCPNLGPYLRVDATFGPTGAIVDTGADIKTSVTPGVRYPLEVPRWMTSPTSKP